jgi:histone-lysine N-methyltransferase SETMAR
LEAGRFRNILTGDESWFTLEYQHFAKLSVSREDGPSRVRYDIGTEKFMLTVIWGVDGFHFVDLMNRQRSFNSEYLVNHVMASTITKAFAQGRTPHACRLHLQLDKYRIHFSKITQQLMGENHILRVPNPPYSPDLAPSHFWLFGHVKTAFVGQTFEEPEELLEAVTECLNEIQRLELELAFSHLPERVRSVLANKGDYYHDQTHLVEKYLSLRFPELWRNYLLTPLYEGIFQ